MSKMTKDEFLRNVAKHEMTVDYDNGFNRRLVFAEPEECNRWFELVTWREHLCFSGDMGTFVFRYVSNDMFRFFRRDDLGINEGYWHQKLVAQDMRDGALYYSEELFEETIKDLFQEWVNDSEIDEINKTEAWNEVENEILSKSEFECEARHAVDDFESSYGFEIRDFWETPLQEFHGRFLWCLYAIVWGIQQYDKQLTVSSKQSSEKKKEAFEVIKEAIKNGEFSAKEFLDHCHNIGGEHHVGGHLNNFDAMKISFIDKQSLGICCLEEAKIEFNQTIKKLQLDGIIKDEDFC